MTNGADCSGFVMSVFANFGYSLPRVAAAQCDASTKKDISQLEPGDLVFYGSGY
ncbi:C40 family peptidase, partial [Erysipelatoclostridium ramosum]|nr:C40 family peptidase [Thomasclavelia ramosa]